MDLDRLTEAARRRPSLVFICSPNNPTGGALQVAAALDRLAAAAPGTFVVVDEAYWEFAGATALPLLESHPNLILIRTMSKAFCLAGLRLGFAIAHPDVAARLDTARMLFNIGALTAAVGAAALRDALGETPYVREVVRSVAAGSERLAEGLTSLPGVHPYPSLTKEPAASHVDSAALVRRVWPLLSSISIPPPRVDTWYAADMEYQRDERRAHLIVYHLLFCPKRRKAVLVGEIAGDCEARIRRKREQHGWDVLALEVMPDHVHLFVRAWPTDAASEVVREVKGLTSHEPRLKYPSLLKMPSLWTRSYFASTAGNVPRDTIRRYIEAQKGV